jgi:predicted SprT family Zn-dependent metalloprotease
MSDKNLPIVLIACKRNRSINHGVEAQSSADNYAQRCDSRQAYKLPSRINTVVSYKCVKCGYTWNTPVGGQFHGI